MALIFPKTVFRLRLQLAGQYRPTKDPNVNLSPSPLVTVTGTTVVSDDAAAATMLLLRCCSSAAAAAHAQNRSVPEREKNTDQSEQKTKGNASEA